MCKNFLTTDLKFPVAGISSCFCRSFSANEIVCSWSNFTADMSGVVLVTVNSAMVQNNSVTYQYLNNPVYTGLTPQQNHQSVSEMMCQVNVILLSSSSCTCSGGIKLTFTGQYLNVSQQPRLQFNNDLQTTTVSIIQQLILY